MLHTLRIGTPIILGNVTQMALGLIDMAMVGSIDYVQLAAGALVNNVLAIPLIAGIGLTTALTPLVAISNGQDDPWSVSNYLFNGVFICTLAAIFIALGINFSHSILYNLGQELDVATLAEPYLRIVGWSIIPMIFFLSMKQFCDALEYTKVAMVLSFISLPINTFLNWVFIFGKFGFPRMELYGAGIGTLITRIIIAVVLLIVILKSRRFKKFIDLKKSAWKLQLSALIQLLKIGIPSSLQYGLESGAFAVSGIMIGWFGATQQAAHQIALNIASFTFMMIMGISTAGSIRISNALGKNQIVNMRKIGNSTLLLGGGFGVIFAISFVALHQYLPYIFNQQAEVVALAGQLLIFAALFQISDSTQAIAVGLLRGIKDVKAPTVIVTIAYWVLGIPIGYIIGVHFGYKAKGMWIGLVFGLTVSSILLNLRFRSQTKKLEQQIGSVVE